MREPLAGVEVERLDLGLGRSAHRAVVALPGGSTVLAVVTHLHHTVDGAAERDRQTGTLLDWLDRRPADRCAHRDGRLQRRPREPTHARMVGAGYRSAYAEANGAEPAVTWPSGLQAPAMDTDGDPGCLDYIWVRGAVRVESARLAFDRPDPEDPTLYPSDHLGISARLEIG